MGTDSHLEVGLLTFSSGMFMRPLSFQSVGGSRRAAREPTPAHKENLSWPKRRPGLEAMVSRDRRINDNQPAGYRSVPL